MEKNLELPAAEQVAINKPFTHTSIAAPSTSRSLVPSITEQLGGHDPLTAASLSATQLIAKITTRPTKVETDEIAARLAPANPMRLAQQGLASSNNASTDDFQHIMRLRQEATSLRNAA